MKHTHWNVEQLFMATVIDGIWAVLLVVSGFLLHFIQAPKWVGAALRISGIIKAVSFLIGGYLLNHFIKDHNKELEND